MKRTKLRKALGRAGIYLVWIIATLVILFPIYWMFVVSARSRVELFGGPNLLQTHFFAPNYTKPLSNPTFQRYLVNSVIIATSNALLVSLLAVGATYALSRWRLKGEGASSSGRSPTAWRRPRRSCCRFSCFLPGLPRSATASLFDTRIGLILLYCMFNLPFAIWLLKGIMDGIPIELDEAALVDGASTFTVLRKIIVPLAAPGIAITFVLSWVFAWNEYLFAATLTSVNARTVTTGLAEFVTVTGTNWGEMAALAMVSLLPALLFLTLVQRYIVTGLTFGAVKG